jgi:adenosine kinase
MNTKLYVFLSRYGLLPNNAILADERTAGLTADMVSRFPVTYTAGGAGQNTLRAAQWQLPPGSTVYVSCVGSDAFGTKLAEEAAADGVQVHYMIDKEKPTGTCATLINNNGLYRSLVADLGAALSMTASYIECHPEFLVAPYVFYVTGFMMNVSLEAVLLLAEHAHQSNKIFVLNLSAPFVCSVFGDALMQAYAYADLVFGNETELRAFAALNHLPLPSTTEDVSELVRAMASLPKKSRTFRRRIVIITQGPLPVVVSDGEEVLQVAVPPIPPKELVDANGAGDAFAGGFLAAFLLGQNLLACVQMGISSAAYILRTSGIVFPRARSPLPQ